MAHQCSYRPGRLSVTCFVLLTFLVGAFSSCTREDTAPGGEANSAKDQETQQRERGAQIVEEYRKNEAAPYRQGRLQLTMTQPKEAKKVYEIEVWRKQTSEGRDTLVRILKPETEKDLASLSIERKGQNTVNVTYDKSTGEFQESDSTRQGLGGLTAQEMLGEWDGYDHRLIGEKEIEGVKTYEVESTLKPNVPSRIKRFVTYFRMDNSMPAEAHLFDATDKEIRTIRVKEYRTIEGRPVIWRLEVTNHVRNLKMAVDVINQSVEKKIDDKVFTRENLKRLASA
ncbi:MAG TPA: outer membrane lipoprotein-sorting protein [Pyrinomonadaceae bacterium]|nr:outer membrane lipoprotein-sorting protein [Pyrinomonadaceae bacterium]